MEHFRLPKSILTHEIMEKPLELRLFLKIVGNACYREGVQVSGKSLGKGQWIRSNRKLQGDLKASPNKLVKAIKWLEGKRLITTEKSQLGYIFTVIKFEIYQGKERYPNDNTGVTQSVTGVTDRITEGVTHPVTRLINNNIPLSIDRLNNKSNKVLNIDRDRSVRGAMERERDSRLIEWEKYPHLDF
jgi:hypothetical protein